MMQMDGRKVAARQESESSSLKKEAIAPRAEESQSPLVSASLPKREQGLHDSPTTGPISWKNRWPKDSSMYKKCEQAVKKFEERKAEDAPKGFLGRVGRILGDVLEPKTAEEAATLATMGSIDHSLTKFIKGCFFAIKGMVVSFADSIIKKYNDMLDRWMPNPDSFKIRPFSWPKGKPFPPARVAMVNGIVEYPPATE